MAPGFVFSQATHKTDWFKKASYGLLVHYLFSLQNGKEPWSQGKITSWDSCVKSFNAIKFADAVEQTGAGYVIFTIQQNDQYFSCPNSTFEQITGYRRGTATPHRDLIDEIYSALKVKGIALMLYVTGNGPYTDARSLNVLTNRSYQVKRDKDRGDLFMVNNYFVKAWSLVLKDISVRYKTKIKGWWVDGAYSFIGYNESSMAVLSKALKAGNRNAIIAFNQSPMDSVSYYSKLDDYTAGEMYHINSLPNQRFLKNAQWHALTFLGKDWGQPGVRFSVGEIENYIRNCNKKGGVVTLDVCLYRDGSLDNEQIQVLNNIKRTIGR